jgi:hypothetical protein
MAKKTGKIIMVNVCSHPEPTDNKPSRWKEHLERLEAKRKNNSSTKSEFLHK